MLYDRSAWQLSEEMKQIVVSIGKRVGAIAKETYDRTKADYDISAATLNSAKARLAQAEAQLAQALKQRDSTATRIAQQRSALVRAARAARRVLAGRPVRKRKISKSYRGTRPKPVGRISKASRRSVMVASFGETSLALSTSRSSRGVPEYSAVPTGASMFRADRPTRVCPCVGP